jgi:hypothetical protein
MGVSEECTIFWLLEDEDHASTKYLLMKKKEINPRSKELDFD